MEIADEVLPLAKVSDGGSLWFLITNRHLHWFEMRRNDIEIFESTSRSPELRKDRSSEALGRLYMARFGCKQK